MRSEARRCMQQPSARGWLRVALLGVLVVKVGMAGLWTGGLLGAGEASAADAKIPKTAKARPAEGPSTVTSGRRPPVRDILAALEERQRELDAREQEMERRAERLALLEQDVTAKIAALEQIEKRLAGAAKTRRTSGDEAAESLAKIYAAMKPGDAAPILDQLDDRTVLTIFERMREKQIGEILPLMSRERAIVLTQAIALRR